jgi:NTP pyrophosphatase (non-canonical NTP hydrolase)
MGLNDLRDEALRIAVEHGFTDASIGEDLMLMVSELAEALEDYRAGKKPDEVWYETRRDGSGAGGFDKDGEVVQSIQTLVSRWRTPEAMRQPNDPIRKPCGIPSELADVLIRVFHFCGKHGIDIEKAVHEKMAYNANRPFKHGNKVL